MNIPQLNLFSFAFVDPSMMFSTMTLKYGRHFDDPQPRLAPPWQDCRAIVLRSPEDGNWQNDTGLQANTPLYEAWPSARQLVAAAMQKVTEHLAAENFQLGQVYVESLQPGGTFGWHTDDSPYAKAHQRFRLLVSPCAGGIWFSGNESVPPGVGNLTYFNNRVPHSLINLGPVPQISLVMDVRKPMLQ